LLVRSTRITAICRSSTDINASLGRDTTAGLLGWTFYLLVRHPAIYDKLRGVILDQFGTYEHPHDITFANLKTCTYLQHILSEVLRLYANVPINSRRATTDTTLPRGGGSDGLSPVYVQKGKEVNYVVHAMHRRKDLWGPDADEFKPDRWVGRKPGWEFLPFNGGPRICLGQQFALTEAGYVIVRIVQKYDKIINEDHEPITRHAYSLTTAPKEVLVRLHEAR
jgi:cytochrome P450